MPPPNLKLDTRLSTAVPRPKCVKYTEVHREVRIIKPWKKMGWDGMYMTDRDVGFGVRVE